MIDAFYLFYITWLESDLHSIYNDKIQTLYNKYNVNENGVNGIEKNCKNFKN